MRLPTRCSPPIERILDKDPSIRCKAGTGRPEAGVVTSGMRGRTPRPLRSTWHHAGSCRRWHQLPTRSRHGVDGRCVLPSLHGQDGMDGFRGVCRSQLMQISRVSQQRTRRDRFVDHLPCNSTLIVLREKWATCFACPRQTRSEARQHSNTTVSAQRQARGTTHYSLLLDMIRARCFRAVRAPRVTSLQSAGQPWQSQHQPRHVTRSVARVSLQYYGHSTGTSRRAGRGQSPLLVAMHTATSTAPRCAHGCSTSHSVVRYSLGTSQQLIQF